MQVFQKEELINNAGPVRGPMAEVDHDSLKYISKADLQAIAVYLQTVPNPKAKIVAATTQKAKSKTLLQPQQKKNVILILQHCLSEKLSIQKVCSLCHEKGLAGAPQIYDTANWTQRLKQGLPTLYMHAINGFNQMPPKGTCVTCTDDEIKAAVDYLVDTANLHQNCISLLERKFETGYVDCIRKTSL